MRNWPLRRQGDQVTPSELGCKGHAWADEEQTEEEAQSPQIMLLSFQAPKPAPPCRIVLTHLNIHLPTLPHWLSSAVPHIPANRQML